VLGEPVAASVSAVLPCTSVTPPTETCAVPFCCIVTLTPASEASWPSAFCSWSLSELAPDPPLFAVTIDWLSDATWARRLLVCVTFASSSLAVFVASWLSCVDASLRLVTRPWAMSTIWVRGARLDGSCAIASQADQKFDSCPAMLVFALCVVDAEEFCPSGKTSWIPVSTCWSAPMFDSDPWACRLFALSRRSLACAIEVTCTPLPTSTVPPPGIAASDALSVTYPGVWEFAMFCVAASISAIEAFSPEMAMLSPWSMSLRPSC
jgi:hypothetical protein